MQIYRFVVQSGQFDPRSVGYLKDVLALGFNNLQRIECQDLYFIEGQLQQEELQQLALSLLTDPVTQTTSFEALPAPQISLNPDTIRVEAALRPGVTDPVAGQIVRAAHELGFKGVHRAATGSRFELMFDTCDPQEQASLAEKLARQLLANPVIQRWTLGEITPSFPEEAASSGAVEILPIRLLDEDGLLEVSINRRGALDLAEMKAIQAYYRAEGRDPSDVEFESIAQTWSEHCNHKTFKAHLDISLPDGGPAEPAVVDSIIKTYLKAATDSIAAPWVISAFVDNAGILEFDDDFEISFKVETHNHPSAIEPFGGANTGVGGVIRDVLGVSAKPIANTDILCFGPQDTHLDELPEGVLHPRRIQSGVVAGVQDYGNKIGIPTVNGAILYDAGYTANPLVFCGCVGIAPRGRHHKNPQPGDRVILLGGRTGRDGLRGATFSSMTMDAQTGEVSGASVQIGDPITEKGLIDVILRARDLGLYSDITDCGAGGLSSAAGEMASSIGADIELENVQLKYPGLAPWEIWLSEAQERMVLAVPPANISALQDLCDTFDTELTDIGEFTGSARLVVRHAGQVVLDLANSFLHAGFPQRQLKAILPEAHSQPADNQDKGSDTTLAKKADHSSTLLALLSHANIASKAATIRLYDHEIQGGTVVKPLAGILNDGPSDAAVLKPIGTRGKRGIVLSNGINPEYGKVNAYRMAWAVVDEAVRNAICVGADPGRIAVLDNFCWGDPKRPETMGTLIEAARGCHDAAIHYGTPYISGKDSLNNEYLGADGQRHAIPPTLLISALGQIEAVSQAITMDLKKAGNFIYLAGDFQPTFGGSHFSMVTHHTSSEDVPAPSPVAPQVYRSFHQAIQAGWVKSAHDLSEGGLAVAAAEMCIGGRLGLHLDLCIVPHRSARTLFGETNGCLLAEVAPEDTAAFEKAFENKPILRVGSVTSDPVLVMCMNNETQLSLPVADLVTAWNPVPELLRPEN
ncbi:MAG TPA: phosphoribosylformylglycinamidine synthase [Anaerolineae bacterium]|nr:phosphoribosylformylglycinamidine synthase [Anaerolineae bacterium]HCC78299.1 phosphoribosylformylglycinamidine synthase [Anaerolineae bacterium]HCM97675.1 phosphoribosylformylglycinamidine synthase [Anaerolineae bacterium]